MISYAHSFRYKYDRAGSYTRSVSFLARFIAREQSEREGARVTDGSSFIVVDDR